MRPKETYDGAVFSGNSAMAYNLVALSDYIEPPTKITVVLKDRQELEALPCRIPLDSTVHILENPTQEYPLKNDKTTFYICQGHSCLPPTNEL